MGVEDAVTLCVCAPPSLQLANTYRVPAVPWGDATFTVWLLPEVHWVVYGAICNTPSTMICKPDGTVVIVIPCGADVKLAVTLRGELIVTDTGFVPPVASPLQEVNCWPPLGEAVEQHRAAAVVEVA